MKHRWHTENYFPPGFPWKPWRNLIISVYPASVLFSSACYFTRLKGCYDSLFNELSKGRELLPGAVMSLFGNLLEGCSFGFIVLIVCMLALTIANYRYHYQGSKSIYLMRRLPKKYEMAKRCLLLPVAVIFVSLATICLLLVIYYQIYLFVTPEQCLLPDQWQIFWSQFQNQ